MSESPDEDERQALGRDGTRAAADDRRREAELTAPIVAVTVFPDRARVTRRGTVRFPPGEHRVVLAGLPLALHTDSVRVAGTGPATVTGVDVAREHRPRTAHEVARELQDQLQAARSALAAVEDEDAVAAGRLEFLDGLARRSTRSYAKALAAGDTDPARVAALSDALAGQQAIVRQERRALVRKREQAEERVEAAQRSLDARQRQTEPDHNAATISLSVRAGSPPAGSLPAGPAGPVAAGSMATSSVDSRSVESGRDESGSGETSIELDVSYVVDGAGWRSAYDLRLDADTVTMTWFGLVTQATGEDWPECDLRLSTARPSSAVSVPELDPWFLDRARPVPPPRPMRAGGPQAYGETYGHPAAAPGGGAMAPMTFAAAEVLAVVDSVATVEQGVTAATYRPARAVAVPADGGAHRATVAILELAADRDYLTAPVRAAEAHLRATVSNTSAHTLPPGRAAVFHGGDFVGTAEVKVWAPGEELRLALGVDDRIRVERKLVRRSATKAVLGSARRREAEHTITVSNHTPNQARVTVLDQVPVSRDEGIVVKEQRVDPAPSERTDMGVLTWVLDLGPGESREIHLGVRVEEARGVEIVGWRE